MSGADVDAVLAWQAGKQAQPITSKLVLHLGYNAEGITGIYSPDTLTPALQAAAKSFQWISHT